MESPDVQPIIHNEKRINPIMSNSTVPNAPQKDNQERLPWLFFWFTLIITIVFLGIAIINNRTFKASEQTIIDAHTDLLQQTDSICMANRMQILSQYDTCITKGNLVLDAELEKQWLNLEIKQSYEDVKHLLELEFNKIQHEYDVLALWGGILTIVFLIFTFYSMGKTDEINRHSQELVKEIEGHQTKVKEKVVSIDSTIETAAKDAAAKTNKKLTDIEKKIPTINESQKNLETQLSEYLKSSEAANRGIEEINTAITQTKTALRDEFRSEMDSRFRMSEQRLETSKKNLDSMDERYSTLTEQINELEVKIQKIIDSIEQKAEADNNDND